MRILRHGSVVSQKEEPRRPLRISDYAVDRQSMRPEPTALMKRQLGRCFEKRKVVTNAKLRSMWVV